MARSGEFEARCMYFPVCWTLGPLCPQAAGARRASPLLERLEWSPYSSSTAQPECPRQERPARCPPTEPLHTHRAPGGAGLFAIPARGPGLVLGRAWSEGWLPAHDAGPIMVSSAPGSELQRGWWLKKEKGTLFSCLQNV